MHVETGALPFLEIYKNNVIFYKRIFTPERYNVSMIEEGVPIVPGMYVRHDEGGLLYQVDDLRRSTIGYERTHRLGGLMVNYTQKEAGQFPVDTKWTKDEEGFRQSFTPVQEHASEQQL